MTKNMYSVLCCAVHSHVGIRPFPTVLCCSGILQRSSIVQDASDGADSGAPTAPLTESLVLSGPDQVHPAPVVWVLVEEPVALFDIAGEDVAYVEAIHDAGTVIYQVHHLSAKLNPLIQAHVE